MEFKLSEALPIYSTGRGAVSSDRLKSAGDLAVSAVGSGLLHQQSDCRRMIDTDCACASTGLGAGDRNEAARSVELLGTGS